MDWHATVAKSPAPPAITPARTGASKPWPELWWSCPTPKPDLITTASPKPSSDLFAAGFGCDGERRRPMTESESPYEPEPQKADSRRSCRVERPRRPRFSPSSRYIQTQPHGISEGRRIDPRRGRIPPAHGLWRPTRRRRGAGPQIDSGRDGLGALWIGGRYGSAQPGLREVVGAGGRRQHHPRLIYENRRSFGRSRERRRHARGRLRRHSTGGGRRPRLRPPDSPHGARALGGAGAGRAPFAVRPGVDDRLSRWC